MDTQNLCFKQKYEKILEFLSENFQFLVVIFQYILRGKNKYTGNYFFFISHWSFTYVHYLLIL